MTPEPLLVYNNTKLAVSPVDQSKLFVNKSELVAKNKKTSWNSKQRRCFHRIKSGMKRAKAQGKQMRFMTLTTKRDVEQKNLNDDFQKLRKRIKRLKPYKMVKDGYIKPTEIHKYYPNTAIGEFLEFEHLKVRTSEGGGVLHVLFKGDYIPRKWLCDNWSDIRNGSWNVDIRLCRDDHAGYVVNQYLSDQSAFERYSWSWGWVYRGFVKNWYLFKDHYMTFKIALNKWDIHLQGRVIKWSPFTELEPDGTFINYTQTELNVEKHYCDLCLPDTRCLPDTSILALSIEKYRKENGLPVCLTDPPT